MSIKKENIKEFRKVNIPRDWEVKKLGEISDIRTGKKDNQDKDENGNYPFFVRSQTIEKINSFSFEGEAILIPGEGNIGEIFHYINGRFDYHQRVYKISDFKNVLGKYIYFRVSYFFRKETIKHSVKATVDSLRLPTFTNMLIPIPPLPEQKAIADLLGTWDVAIANVQKLITQKQQRKKWLMQNLLTGKKRMKGFSEEWKDVHIKDVAKEVSIRNKEDNKLTVLSCTKYDGLVPSLEYFGRKIFADDLSTYKVVPKNHFAYATNHIEEGSIGYQEDFKKALISPMYTVFKTNELINDVFFFKLLKSYPLVYQYQNRMEGSIDRRGGLRWDAFSIIKVKIPSIKEQQAIAQVLEIAEKEINLLKAKAEKLKEQKKGLMQQLLTGKVRLKIK